MSTPYIKLITEHYSVGMYGRSVRLETVDVNGVAFDISAFTTITVQAESPDAQSRISFTGTGDTGGTGWFNFTPTTGVTFDRPGTWKGQVDFGDTGVLASTPLFEFIVDRRLGTG